MFVDPDICLKKKKDRPCKTAKSVLVSVEKKARENFPCSLLSPFKSVVLLLYLSKEEIFDY